MPVVLLEAERVGDRAALDAGWLVDTPGVDFLELQAALGLKDARRAYEASRKAALDVAAFLRRLGPKLAPEPRESLVIAATPADVAALERERAGRAAAGLDAAWLPARRAATESGADLVRGALKTHSEGVIDPWQTARALVDAATSAGARLFEQSPATRVRHTRTGAEVVTAKGVVRAKAVVLATGAPRPLVGRPAASRPRRPHLRRRDRGAAGRHASRRACRRGRPRPSGRRSRPPSPRAGGWSSRAAISRRCRPASPIRP